MPKNSGLEKCRLLASAIAEDKTMVKEIRGEDIPLFVESIIREGKKVIEVTGENLFTEFVLNSKNTKLEILRREIWDEEEFVFRKPSLCLLGPKGRNFEDMGDELRICINSKYKELSKKNCTNLLENKGYKIKKIYVSGASEEFFSKGVADLVIDIVCSGASAERAGLCVYRKLFESDIVVIGENQKLNFDLYALYNRIKERIESGDENSYTKSLVKDELVLKRKLVEEAAEVITARDREQLVMESADLLYFLFIILAKEGISLEEIEEENERRDKVKYTADNTILGEQK